MPELPEVETVVGELRRSLVGRRIVAVRVREWRLRRPIAVDLPTRLRGRRIVGISRHGKFLLFHLDDGAADLVVHLGMSGTIRLHGTTDAGRHDHVIIALDDGHSLTYNDPRRFGLMLLRSAHTGLPTRLGIDPLSPEFTADRLAALARGRRRPIKNLLMDQALIAGLGNIYANEILAQARIRPGRAAGRLTRRDHQAVVDATREVLIAAIRQRGSSISDFRDITGNRGGFQQRFVVYDRCGQPCRRCSTGIRRRMLGGRSTFYCPSCQR